MSNNDIYNLAHTAHNVQVYEQNEHVSNREQKTNNFTLYGNKETYQH